MSLIKKKILLISGGTYNLNILLTENVKDLGVFDTLNDTEMIGQITYADSPSGYTFVNSYDYLNYSEITLPSPYFVSGNSESRLSELRKYTISGGLSALYVTSTGSTFDGLDIAHSFTGITASTYQYYLGGITYVDSIVSPATAFTTTFRFRSLGIADPNNFDNKRYIKIEEKENLVENSQVSSDVFIDRQEQSVFERNYRLRATNSLNNVLTYAGGNYFTIYNNT